MMTTVVKINNLTIDNLYYRVIHKYSHNRNHAVNYRQLSVYADVLALAKVRIYTNIARHECKQ